MKKIFYLSAILAAVACSREPIALDNMESENEATNRELIDVTLIAGSTETRTELQLGCDNKLRPFWSGSDVIGLTSVPDSDTEMANYEFTSTSTSSSLTAEFTGQLLPNDTYFAYYPYIRKIGYDDSNSGSFLYFDYYGSGGYADIVFHLPSEQHPSPTSFDESTDLLISNPFYVDASATTVEGLVFTRVNAIVKVVLEDMTDDKYLIGEGVRSITLGEELVYSNPEKAPAHAPREPRTRADFLPHHEGENGNGPAGLTGWADYEMVYSSNDNDYVWRLYEPFDIQGYVTATYSSTDEGGKGLYHIGSENEAAYFTVFPVIVMNEADYWPGGLPITVETDKYTIRRMVSLPEEGIALQPSRVTTLNIGLYDMDDPDHGYEMSIKERKIAFEKPVVNLLLDDATYGGAYFNLDSYGFIFDYANIAAIQWSYSQDGIVSINFNDVSVYTDKIDGDADSQISGLWMEGLQAGETIVTATFGDLSASFKVKVVGSSREIVFEDQTVRAICLEQWDFDGNGAFTEFEASLVDALTNYNTGDGETLVFWRAQIGAFPELQFFTGLTTLDYAFSYSTIESVQLPQDFKGTTQYAFQYCANLESVVLPEGMTEISSCAFWYCESLTDITLPSTIKYIGGSAFYDCSSLVSINLPNSLTGLGDSAFKGCSSLQSIEIPSSLGTIPSNAFMNCSSLGSVKLHEGLGGINPYAFLGCALHEIVFPSTLEFVSANCFGRNNFLSGEDTYHGITFLGTTPPRVYNTDYNYNNYTAFTGWHWNSDANDWSDYGVHIYVPNESLDAYAALPGLSNSGMNIFVGF